MSPARNTTPAADPSVAAGQAVAAGAGLAVLREVAGDRVSQVLFVTVALAAGVAYSVLLPFDFTLRISLANWQFFSLRYALFAIGLALGLAWLVTLQIYATRRIARRAAGRWRGGEMTGAAGAVISLLPSFLCCSPIVPTIVGLLGLPVATQLSTTGDIAYFFAANQNWLLAGALVLLAASGAWALRKLARAACLHDSCHVVDGVPTATVDDTGQAEPPGPGRSAGRLCTLAQDRRPRGGHQ